MKNKIILSIDPSLSGSALILGTQSGKILGYEYFSDKKSDTQNLHCKFIEKGIPSTEKLDNLICYYLSLINKIDFVIMEAPSFNSTNASSDFKDIYGIIKYLNRRLDIETLLIPPISLKLFFTENAKAEKQQMIDTAIEKYGDIIDFESISKSKRDNMADCIALYELGCTYLNCNRLPAPKGCVDTDDIKPFSLLPLHKKQVIARLYNRDDLYKEVVKLRGKK